MFVSPAGRDNTDDFFSMAVLLVCMYDQQNRPHSGTNGYGSQSVPTLLPCFIDTIKLYQAVGILKHQCRQFEADSALLALILPVFPFIPFVAHCVYTEYITREQDGPHPKRRMTIP